jgi:hypothetical protein
MEGSEVLKKVSGVPPEADQVSGKSRVSAGVDQVSELTELKLRRSDPEH